MVNFFLLITFQSTHPHGVRLFPSVDNKYVIVGFNPRTHTGCDSTALSNEDMAVLFQSTHPHGVRPSSTIAPYRLLVFQSTHPHGVRRLTVQHPVSVVKVSIHAPTRGATGVDPCHEVVSLVSIHAPTRGATLTHPSYDLPAYVSIHAPTRGATDVLRIVREIVPSFNPRTHTGCDPVRLWTRDL